MSSGVSKLLGRSLSASGGIWWNVKSPVGNYAGRLKEVKDLHDILYQKSDENRIALISQVTSISGLGGVGKTELARKYAQIYGNSHYDGNVIWINAESVVSLNDSFKHLADYLDISLVTIDSEKREKDIKVIKNLVYHRFLKVNALFIFDNVQNYEEAAKFFPLDLSPGMKRPFILITSRIQFNELKSIKKLMLDVLEVTEAISFVKTELRNVLSEDAFSLVNCVQFLPLALQQAVSYIRKRNKHRTYLISDYLKEFETKAKELLSFKLPKDNEYTKTVLTTWSITFDGIKKEDGNSLALQILNIIAYFNSDDIPDDMFFQLENSSENAVFEAFDLLEEYSIMKTLTSVEYQAQIKLYSIHRLVQMALQLEHSEHDRKSYVKEALTLLLSRMNKTEETVNFPEGFTLHAVSVLNHSRSFPELSVETIPLEFWYGLRLLEELKPCKAVNIFETVVAKLDCSDDRYMMAKYFLANGLYLKFDFDKSLCILQDLYDVLPQESVLMRLVENDIGLILGEQRAFEEAIRFYESAYMKMVNSTGEKNTKSLYLKMKIGCALCWNERFDKGLEILHEVYEMQKALLGQDHLFTLETGKYYILNCFLSQNPIEATKIINDCYNACQSDLGSDNLNTLFFRLKHIELNMKMGHALDTILKRLYNMSYVHKVIFGDEHVLQFDIKLLLMRVLKTQLKFSEAQKIFEEVLKNYDMIDAKAIFVVKEAGLKIVSCLTNLRDFASALKVMNVTCNKVTERLGSEHIETRKTYLVREMLSCVCHPSEENVQAFGEVISKVEDWTAWGSLDLAIIGYCYEFLNGMNNYRCETACLIDFCDKDIYRFEDDLLTFYRKIFSKRQLTTKENNSDLVKYVGTALVEYRKDLETKDFGKRLKVETLGRLLIRNEYWKEAKEVFTALYKETLQQCGKNDPFTEVARSFLTAADVGQGKLFAFFNISYSTRCLR